MFRVGQGGVVVYQYAEKIRQNTQKYPKFIQIYPKLYPGVLYTWKWYTEYPYLSCNIPYTRLKKPLYTVYPKTLADPGCCTRLHLTFIWTWWWNSRSPSPFGLVRQLSVKFKTICLMPVKILATCHSYRISSNNSRRRLYLFSHKKGAIIPREALISNIAHWKSNKLNMSFLSVPNLVPWLIFRAWQGGGG